MLDFTIRSGQLVRISINEDVYFTGVCFSAKRLRTSSREIINFSYEITGLKTLLTKRTINKAFAAGTTFSNIVTDPLILLAELGITQGYIESDGYAQEAIVCEGQEISTLLDNLASIDGNQWQINNDFELEFSENEDDFSNPANIVDAPYELDSDDINGYGFEDYRNLEIAEDYTNYANTVNVIGAEFGGKTIKGWYYNKEDLNEFTNVCGYGAGATYVYSDTNLVLNPDVRLADTGTTTDYVNDIFAAGSTPTVVRSGDIMYNATRQKYTFVTTVSASTAGGVQYYISPPIVSQTSGDYLHYNSKLNDMAKKLMKTKSSYPPLICNFTTFTSGFKPRQRLWINAPELECCAYFNINTVNISDLGAGKFNFSISGEKKDYEINFTTITQRSYTQYFKRF